MSDNNNDETLLSAAVAFTLIAEKAQFQSARTTDEIAKISLLEIREHCASVLRLIADARQKALKEREMQQKRRKNAIEDIENHYGFSMEEVNSATIDELGERAFSTEGLELIAAKQLSYHDRQISKLLRQW